jgi:hypothetical protein
MLEGLAIIAESAGDSDVRVYIQSFVTISLLYMYERFYFVVLYLYL